MSDMYTIFERENISFLLRNPSDSMSLMDSFIIPLNQLSPQPFLSILPPCRLFLLASTSAHLRMLSMFLPVLCIEFSQFLIVDYEQILRVVLLRSFREIERPCNYDLHINDHDLVVGLNWFETGVDTNK